VVTAGQRALEPLLCRVMYVMILAKVNMLDIDADNESHHHHHHHHHHHIRNPHGHHL
jgi:hypothetical protein